MLESTIFYQTKKSQHVAVNIYLFTATSWLVAHEKSLSSITGHVDKIRSAMAGFQLPTAHIPDWARTITEDQWREQVVNRLVDKKHCDKEVQESDNSRISQNQEAMEQTQSEAGTSVPNVESAEENVTEQNIETSTTW